MTFPRLALLPMLAIGAACGGSGSSDPGTVPQQALFDDSAILSKVYDTGYNVPAGFFVDERAATTRSYTVHHVLDASGSFEICTNDLVEAQAWEEADNASRTVTGYYVTSHENARYFEFVRELAYTEDVGNITDPTSPGFARVFKCDYTVRDGVDRALLDGYAGRLNADNLDAGYLREFTEYLWQFTFLNVSQKKVLASTSDPARLQHTLLLALLVNQGNDACDRVDVVEWRYAADPLTGDVTRHFDVVHSFEASLEAGQPALCD